MILNGTLALAFILRYFIPNSVALGADYVKVVDDRPIISRQKYGPKNLVLRNHDYYGDIRRGH